ncbi:hypothetical protein BO219_13540 [Anoxybacillus kestanbolensis]|uniref:Glycosyltransferase n=1 Tax=Anoxybacillus kestanbolensis TaxID=227476 RepID=A0A1V3FFU9_9BACL|nr:hypothetical protein [Anoxybacillus kestanbolensis]OOE00230.1 hypothetical protein BO219_13540 [Anoxybacillus kestanbolensis]
MGKYGKIKSITFFYPSKKVGGAQFLFVRLANTLAGMGYKTFVIDYPDGFLTKNISREVFCIEYKDGMTVSIDFDTHLILPPIYLNRMNSLFKIKDNAEVFCLFWSLAPHNILMNIRGFYRFSKLVRSSDLEKYFFIFRPFTYVKYQRMLRKIHQLKGIVYMDYPNFQKNNEVFRIGVKPQYVPIPIDTTYLKQKEKLSLLNSSEINIGWLGRLGEEKIQSIIKVWNDINSLKKLLREQKIIFHVIGDGEYRKELERISKKMSFNIVFKGTMNNVDVNNYIINNIDIIFAMGTSALESAYSKVPTISLDFSYSSIPKDYRYLWLYEREGYSLGNPVSKKNKNIHTIRKVLNDLRTSYESIAEKCFNYTKANHSMSKTVEILFEKIRECELTMDFFE